MLMKDFLKQFEDKDINYLTSYLKAREIKGFPKNASMCPIATAIKEKCEGYITVSTFVASDGKNRVNLPWCMVEFIKSFDSGTMTDFIESTHD